MIASLKRGSLRKYLSRHLHDAILEGELRPGDRIVEGKLARQLGVAQGTLREALQELEHQGLVTKQDHRGTFVTKLTAQEIEGIYVVRSELEPIAAALARQRLTSEHVGQLVHLVETMRVAGQAGDFVQLLKTDLAFHRMIWKLSGNKWVERALNAVCPVLFASYLIKSSSGDPYDRTKDLEQHRVLLNALKEGGPEEVEKVFRKIMEAFRLQDIENLRAIEAEREIPPVERQPVLRGSQ